VQAVLAHLLPILGREDVPERVRVVVHDGLRVAGRAAREVDEHDVLGGDGLGRPRRRALPRFRLAGDQLVEAQPALALAAHDDAILDAGRRGQRAFHLRVHVLVSHADHHLDLALVRAVLDVVSRQLQGRGNDRGAQLAERARDDPVLPPAAHDAHDDVALAYAELLERVGRLVRQAADVGERERSLLARIVAPQESPLVGLHARPLVHHVVAEVEIVRHVNLEVIEEILVRIEVDPRAVLAQYVIHCCLLLK